MFKHPTPEDFFRTMEDASAVDLDWFWRSWFYTTDYVDIGVSNVKKYYVSDEPTEEMKEYMAANGLSAADLPPLVYLADLDAKESDEEIKDPISASSTLSEFMMDNMTAEERAKVKQPKYFYEIEFEKPGGIPMPLIVEYTYADGTKEEVRYPVEIWRKNDASVKRVFSSDRELVGITVDPNLETADIDTSNNSWPKVDQGSEFEQLKAQVQQ
jgi:hypothetical protein